MKWDLKGGISIYADSGSPRYVLWCCVRICHQLLTFIQIGSGHTVYLGCFGQSGLQRKKSNLPYLSDNFWTKFGDSYNSESSCWCHQNSGQINGILFRKLFFKAAKSRKKTLQIWGWMPRISKLFWESLNCIQDKNSAQMCVFPISFSVGSLLP